MKKLLSCLLAMVVLLVPTTAIGVQSSETADSNDYSANVAAESILNVCVPTSVDFTIDPFELAGRGQIYSDIPPIVNCGDTDVLLTFTDISVRFADGTDFEPMALPFDGDNGFGGRKSIYLAIDYDRGDDVYFVLTDTEPALPPILLAAGSDENICALRVSGSVNPYPAEEWREGDVHIRLIYQIETLPTIAWETTTTGEPERIETEGTMIPKNGIGEGIPGESSSKENETSDSETLDDMDGDMTAPPTDMTPLDKEASPALVGEPEQTPDSGDGDSSAHETGPTTDEDRQPSEPDTETSLVDGTSNEEAKIDLIDFSRADFKTAANIYELVKRRGGRM